MNKSSSPSHCPWMWHGLSDRDGESLYPCCRFDYFDQPGIPAEGPLPDQINANAFLHWRSEMRLGKSIPSCFKCHEDESIGVESERLVALSEEGEIFPPQDSLKLSQIHNAEAFIGNQCNLRCHTCNPSSSSGWVSEYQKLGWQWHSLRQNTLIADNIASFTNLRTLKVIGGEPAFSKKFDDLILKTPSPEKIEIHISTNATRAFKNETLDILSRFKKVRIALSIDGFGDLNEDIRHPSRWRDIESTVRTYLDICKELPHFHLSMHTTVSLLNVFELLPLLNWWNALSKNPKQSKARFSILRSPSFQSIQNLSISERGRLEELYAVTSDPALAGVKQEIEKKISQAETHQELFDYCAQIDQARGTNLLTRLKKHYSK